MAENKDSKTCYNVDTKNSKYVFVGDNITVKFYQQKDGEPQFIAVAQELEMKPLDTRKASPEYDDPTQCIVVREEMDKNAGREESESGDKSHPAVFETTAVKPKADTNGSRQGNRKTKLINYIRQLLPKGNPGTNGNERQRKLVLNSDKMCHRCIMADETHLPQDRDKWPIAQIENGCFQAICNLLDLHYLSKEPLLSALGLTQNGTTSNPQEFMATRGKGTANKALGIWGTSEHGNNVGAFKKIVKRTMKRDDVFCVIKNWEKLPVCHGCGINLQE